MAHIEYLGKKWDIVLFIPDIINGVQITFETPENILFIPMFIQCEFIIGALSAACQPTFFIADDNGNKFNNFEAPSALPAGDIYHFSALPGIVHNVTTTVNIQVGLNNICPLVNCIIDINLVGAIAGDSLDTPVIVGLVNNENY